VGDTLRLPEVHGERGLTVYTTMSTTCAACSRALPDLQALREAFGIDELTLVGIPVSPEDTSPKLREYVERKDPAYGLQTDLPPSVRGRVCAAVAARLHGDGDATPASIVTDSSGLILAARWGVPTVSELRRLRAHRERPIQTSQRW